MTDVLVLILVAVVVILLVVLLLQARSRSAVPTEPAAPAFDESRLRSLLDQALATRDPQQPGRHAESDAQTAMAAEVQRTQEQVGQLRQELARVKAAEQDARAATAAAVDTARSESRRQAERELADSRADLDRQRSAIARDKARLATDAATALTAERAELQSAQQRLKASVDSLAEDQRRLSMDRERVRAEESEVTRAWAKVSGKEDAIRLEADQLTALGEQLTERTRELDEQAALLEAELVRVSGLSADAARAELLGRQEEIVRRDAALMVRRIESDAEAGAKQRARAIVADAIQRVASDQTAQTVVSVVHLPADEVKGRIIGREGRNIRTFETVTGVNVIIDDTPEAVLLSCFDPVRREIGRITLEMLIEDGRIHPHRIEEAYERAFDEVQVRCARAAEDAMLEVGISDLHPELVTLLGHLKYRTSYGQNVLGHLVETSHIARGMAAELGVDPAVAARGAFLHDIGKALTHEAQGSHAMVGAELARRYGESDDVAHCIEAHHDEVPPSTVEAVLTQAADACSGGRPGARRESLESYVQRLERIESIASAKKGVEKVFAMQAGRELRVMVKPDVIDDLEAHLLAREVAKQIEEELTYPGQVRVTVIRESRATEVAR